MKMNIQLFADGPAIGVTFTINGVSVDMSIASNSSTFATSIENYPIGNARFSYDTSGVYYDGDPLYINTTRILGSYLPADYAGAALITKDTKYVGKVALQELVTKMKQYVDNKEITLDDTVTQNSSNGVKSSGIYTALSGKQASLNTNQLAAVNSGITSTLVGQISTNQNNITSLSSSKQDVLTFDSAPTASSTNPVTSGGIYTTTNGLDTRLTTVEGKIPTAASSSNQLADKAFVNSSIATATATFKGSYDIVYDLELSILQADDHYSVATALGTKVSGEDDNDYAYVLVPANEANGTFAGNGTFTGTGTYGNTYNITITIANGAISSISATDYTTGVSSDFLGSPSDWSGSNGSYSKPSGQGEYMHLVWDTATKTYSLDDDNWIFATLHRPLRQIDRYKYNGTAWVYEYTLNNSGFTAAQWGAINSGITPSLVAQIGTNTTNITSLGTSKQDVIDATHKLSADLVDDTSTTHKFVTASDKTTWNGKQDAMTAITTAEVDTLFE